MRIIAGEARGRTLLTPKGMDTRPTLDRVRESLFNILHGYIQDAHVLDLFAGSGALGLECLSRGAASTVFVDIARAAQEAVARNISTLRMEDRATLLRCDWRAALRKLSTGATRFDLVFLDPPYRMEHADTMLEAVRTSGLLAGDALVIYEHAKALPPSTTRWHIWDKRLYGDTDITFLQPAEKGDADADSALPGQL